jgi:DNA repair protein RecO (recombination protein O)
LGYRQLEDADKQKVICKTEGIVLRVMRFQESSLILTLYTLEEGRADFLVKGARSSRSHSRHARYQLGAVLDIVYYTKPGRELHLLTESALKRHPQEIDRQPVRILYLMLVCEVFRSAVNEPEASPELYYYLREAITTLDTLPQHLFEYTLHMLLQLTAYLGFFPRIEAEPTAAHIDFDVENGWFHAVDFPTPEAHRQLLLLASADHWEDGLIGARPSAPVRRQMLETLLRYYELHVDGFRLPQSVEVFADVFHTS